MSPLVPALLLIGFFVAMTAYWCWSRAREAAVDADLQQRLWNHSKYQRDFEGQTPLEVSEWLRTERTKYRRFAAVLSVVSLGCFAFALINLNRLH